MQNAEERFIEIDGVRFEVQFASEMTDEERQQLGMPARGTPCACPDCTCTNESDMGTPEHPRCGCCVADCPDVHGPEAYLRETRTWSPIESPDAAPSPERE